VASCCLHMQATPRPAGPLNSDVRLQPLSRFNYGVHHEVFAAVHVLARLVGIWFLLSGLIGLSATLLSITCAVSDSAMALVAFLVAALVGASLLLLKAYGPDLGWKTSPPRA
jgi:hypothetical protein